jgi:hypothetical protein
MPGARAAQGHSIHDTTLRDPDRPVLFAAYTFRVCVPPSRFGTDTEADQLLAKLEDAFGKIEGAARTLLAEIDPALTLTLEDA